MTTTHQQPAQYLSSNQEELLLTALASNRPKSHNTVAKSTIHNTHSDNMRSAEMNGTMFTPDLSASSTLDNNFELQNTPYMGYVDGDTSFDNLDDSELIGAYPDEFNGHEKRKNSDLDLDTEDEKGGDLKRKEGDDKQAKKPGRKPLTSEPTTKRKAQNRAAQRAFRERKEQHLKDLETKVSELTKSSEADKHENGLLRAQVERLQTELRDYRKRLSSDASRNRSPPAYAATTNEPTRNYFAFDFPAFGNLPGVQMPSTSSQALSNGNGDGSNSVSPSATHRPSTTSQTSSGQQSLRREDSSYSNFSNRSNSIINNASGVQTNKSTTEVDSFAGLFSPSILNGAKFGTENNDYGFPTANSPAVQPQNNMQSNGTETNSGLSRVFRFNSASVSSNNDSPSQSSMSHFNANSSCNTSPESSHPSPPKDLNQSYLLDPQITLLGDNSNMNAFTAPSPGKGIDWLAAQNGGQFDPLLFGDYRESQDAIIGDGDFNNGFFNDAFPYDFGSPLNFDLSSPKVQQQQLAQHGQSQGQAQPASKKCLANAEKIREGVDDDYGLPGTQASANNSSRAKQPGDKSAAEMLSANTIWNQLQNNKDFQDGKFDLDALCSELRSKAKCSESGVVVPASEVDVAFAKLSGQPGKCPQLVWPKEYVDETMSKLSGGTSTSTSNWGGMGL